ncbi:hypothetical protein RF11_06307 [Thelohanellus kitauei]|uniref:Uncharacterized protein n=1 Tax=Thelohanellus kitauei TaxID=669202 RepID=A0A0C2MVC5_THEKT|nr:hypothetical protein RF11_06307 [Thelohanellus kitauei]
MIIGSTRFSPFKNIPKSYQESCHNIMERIGRLGNGGSGLGRSNLQTYSERSEIEFDVSTAWCVPLVAISTFYLIVGLIMLCYYIFNRRGFRRMFGKLNLHKPYPDVRKPDDFVNRNIQTTNI